MSHMFSSISFRVDAFGEFDAPGVLPGHGYPSAWFTAQFKDTFPQDADEKLCSNLISLAPRECAVGFVKALNTRAVRDLLVTMPNTEGLYLMGSVVSDMFLQTNPLPSLRHLSLDHLTLPSDDDWSTPTT